MADGLNQKINDHDSISTILSSDNFEPMKLFL